MLVRLLFINYDDSIDTNTMYLVFESNKKLSETDIIKMFKFLNENIFVMFVGHVLQVRRLTYGYNLCSYSR